MPHPSKNLDIREAVRDYTEENPILTRADLRRLLDENRTFGELYWLRTLVSEGYLSPVSIGKYCAPHKIAAARMEVDALLSAKKAAKEQAKQRGDEFQRAKLQRMAEGKARVQQVKEAARQAKREARIQIAEQRLALAEAFAVQELHPLENQRIWIGGSWRDGVHTPEHWGVGDEPTSVSARILSGRYAKTSGADKRINTDVFVQALARMVESGIVVDIHGSATAPKPTTIYYVTHPKGMQHVKMARLLA